MTYTCTSKDLMKEVTKLPKKKVEAMNFVIISNRIRVTKERDNVLVATNLMINGGMLKGVGMDVSTDSPLAIDQFRYFLLKDTRALGLITTMLECDFAAGEDSLLLCSPKEYEVGYMQTICKAVEVLFHYPIQHYPKKKDFTMEEKEDIIRRILYYKKQLKKVKLKNMSDGERMEFIFSLNKKQLKKLIKKRGGDTEGLSRQEMEDLAIDLLR